MYSTKCNGLGLVCRCVCYQENVKGFYVSEKFDVQQ